MARLLCLPLTGAASLFTLVIVLTGFAPFLGAAPTVGASPAVRAHTFVVNRAGKGDRLPVAAGAAKPSAYDRPEQSQQQPPGPPKIPVGCEGAFSPVSSPRLAFVYRRCIT